jgi:membrane protein
VTMLRAADWNTLLRKTLAGWWEDKAPRLGAALAFYTALSIAPILILVAPAADLMFGADAGRRQIVGQFEQLFGADAGNAVKMMIASDALNRPGVGATLLGVGVLLFAASGVFAELQDALDTIWEVRPKPTNKAAALALLRQRVVSFGMVLGLGFLLMVSLVLTAALNALREHARPDVAALAQAWSAANAVLSLVVIAVLFATIFKVLPDVDVKWRDVWLGALLTSGLFAVGRYAIGQYVGRTTLWSSYGAGKSLIVLLVWIYYSAQILFLGAEFTKAYTALRGARVRPTEGAVPVTEEARAQAGIPHEEVVQATAEVVQRKADAADDGQTPGGTG